MVRTPGNRSVSATLPHAIAHRTYVEIRLCAAQTIVFTRIFVIAVSVTWPALSVGAATSHITCPPNLCPCADAGARLEPSRPIADRPVPPSATGQAQSDGNPRAAPGPASAGTGQSGRTAAIRACGARAGRDHRTTRAPAPLSPAPGLQARRQCGSTLSAPSSGSCGQGQLLGPAQLIKIEHHDHPFAQGRQPLQEPYDIIPARSGGLCRLSLSSMTISLTESTISIFGQSQHGLKACRARSVCRAMLKVE